MDTSPATPERPRSPRVLIVGSGDVASAVAHFFFGAGYPVVIREDDCPATARRGMAFSDAVFSGKSWLAGVLAKRCPDSNALSAMLGCAKAVPVMVGELTQTARQVRPDVVVDARMRKRERPENLRLVASLSVGIGPGFECGNQVDWVVESRWGPQLGHVLTVGQAAPFEGEPRPLGGAGRERFVYAVHDGEFRTPFEIGARTAAGDIVGYLDGKSIAAPLSGAIRGLVHDRVPVRAGMKLLEIDPSAEPHCFGLGERPCAIASGVLQEVQRMCADAPA
jgi:xanthine dehydrogenase accessory factor